MFVRHISPREDHRISAIRAHDAAQHCQLIRLTEEEITLSSHIPSLYVTIL